MSAETETPISGLPDAKSQLIGKDPDAGKLEGRRRRFQLSWFRNEVIMESRA